jgi:hypothetical protein
MPVTIRRNARPRRPREGRVPAHSRPSARAAAKFRFSITIARDPATITEQDARGLGLGLFGVTLTPADLAGRASLQFVRRYRDGRWEGATRHDVALGAPGPGTLRLKTRAR